MLCAAMTLIMAGCTYVTPKGELDTGHFITINLTKEEVRANSKYDMKTGLNSMGGSSSGNGVGAALIVAVVPLIMLTEVAINVAQGGDKIYVYPENHKEQFSQQLQWGENRVYVPEEFKNNGGNLVFFAKGARVGTWTTSYSPGKNGEIIFDGFADAGQDEK